MVPSAAGRLGAGGVLLFTVKNVVRFTQYVVEKVAAKREGTRSGDAPEGLCPCFGLRRLPFEIFRKNVNKRIEEK